MAVAPAHHLQGVINGRRQSSSYASAIRQYDMLEQGQEQELATRWHELGDRSAAHALVTSHLRLAAKVAKQYRRYGLPMADLIAEANLGLVLAASRFEPGRGSRFSTYALWWIKATIQEYVLRSWSLVKIGTTSTQRRLFFRLRGEMKKLGGGPVRLNEETAQTIAENLGVTARDVLDMDCRLNGDLSLNKPINDDGQTVEWQAMLADDSPNAESILEEQDESFQQTNAVRAALDVLSGRERRIFVARRLTEQPPTLDQLGREMCISPERVRQIEARAFAKVQRAALLDFRPVFRNCDGDRSERPVRRSAQRSDRPWPDDRLHSVQHRVQRAPAGQAGRTSG
jgi:RNA polymerase sigma-32 factor